MVTRGEGGQGGIDQEFGLDVSHTAIFKIGNWGIPWWSSERQASTAGGAGSIPGWRTKLLQTPAKAQPKIINKYYIHIERYTHTYIYTCCSLAKSCLTLLDSMDHSTPGSNMLSQFRMVITFSFPPDIIIENLKLSEFRFIGLMQGTHKSGEF